MPKWMNETAKRAARTVNLYDFLMSMHPEDVVNEGNSLRLRNNHSVSVKHGYCGFTDFSNGETGNSIDCLVHFLGYEFTDAVAALCSFAGLDTAKSSEKSPLQDTPMKASQMPKNTLKTPQAVNNAFTPPKPLQGPYRQLFAYMTQTRGIPLQVVQRLIDWNLLYQEPEHANMVFIDPAQTFVELRGTNSSKPFHQVQFSDPAAFWWFKPRGPSSNPTVAYVCEAAIDAISLYLLLGCDAGTHAYDGLYCSIGGVANQQRIDRIKAKMLAAGCQTVIAVDNDAAGEKCRQRNPDCKYLVPYHKDWNDDLIDIESDPHHAAHDPAWLGRMIDLHIKMG